MAIANYGDLQLELAERMHRDDLTNRIVVSIQLATKRFSRELRTPEMEVLAETTVSGEWTALPINFLEVRAVYTDSAPLEYMTPWQIRELARRTYTPAKPVYTIADMSFQVYPTQSATDVKILYYAKIPDFVSGTDTNWLLDKYPDAYIECAMSDLCKQVKDYAASREHEAYVQKFIADMKRQSSAIHSGAAPLSIRAY